MCSLRNPGDSVKTLEDQMAVYAAYHLRARSETRRSKKNRREVGRSVKTRGRLLELQDLFVDFSCVRRLRPPPQIILQVGQRRPEAFELLVHQPPIPKFLDRLRHHEQHSVHDCERLFKLSRLRIDVLQIAQDPRDDLARGRRLQILVELRLLRFPGGQNLRQALAQIGLGLRLPPREGIEHELTALDRELDEKMPG